MLEEKVLTTPEIKSDEKYEGYFKITATAVNVRVKPGGNRKDKIAFVLMEGETIFCDGKYAQANGEDYLLVGGGDSKGYIPVKFTKKL